MGSPIMDYVCAALALASIVVIEFRYGFGGNSLLSGFDADKAEYTAPMRGRKPRSRAPVFQNSLAPFMDSSFASDAGLSCTPLDDLNHAVRADPYNFENFYQQKNTSKAIKKAMRKAAQQYFREMTTFGMIDVEGGKDVFLDANSSEFEHKAGQRGARSCLYNRHDFPFLDHSRVQSYTEADNDKKASCFRRTELMGAGISTNWSKGCTAADFKKRSSHVFPNDGIADGRCSNATRFLDDLTFHEFREYRALYKQLLKNAGNVTELMPKDARTKCNLQTDDLWHDSCMEADFNIMVKHEYNGVKQLQKGKLSIMGMTISERTTAANFLDPNDAMGTTTADGEAGEAVSGSTSAVEANADFTVFIGRESCYEGITLKSGSSSTTTADKVNDYLTLTTSDTSFNGVGKKCTAFPVYDTHKDSGDMKQLSCLIDKREFMDPFIIVTRNRWAECFSPKGVTEHNLFWNFITNVAYLAKTQSNAAMCRRNLLVQAITRGHGEIYNEIKASDSTFNLHAFYDATSGPPLKRSNVGIFAVGSSANKNKGTDESIMKALYIVFGILLILIGAVVIRHAVMAAASSSTKPAMGYAAMAVVAVTFIVAAVIFGFERRVFFKALETQRAPLDVLGTCLDDETASDQKHFMDLYEQKSAFSLIVIPLLGIVATMVAYYMIPVDNSKRYKLGMLSNLLFLAMFIMVIIAAENSNQLSKGKQVLSAKFVEGCGKRHLGNLKNGTGVVVAFAAIGAVVAFVLLVLGAYHRGDGWKTITGLGEHIVWAAMIAISVLSTIFLYRYNQGLTDISLVAPISMEDRLKDDMGYAQGSLASILVTAFPIIGILWVCLAIVAAVASESIGKAFTTASMGRFM